MCFILAILGHSCYGDGFVLGSFKTWICDDQCSQQRQTTPKALNQQPQIQKQTAEFRTERPSSKLSPGRWKGLGCVLGFASGVVGGFSVLGFPVLGVGGLSIRV